MVGTNVALLRPSPISGNDAGAIKFAVRYSEDSLVALNANPDSFVVAAVDFSEHLQVPHVLSPNPRLDYCRLLSHFFPIEWPKRIESTAVVSPTAIIGGGAYVGHGVIIEDGVRIGDETVILHNTVIAAGVKIGTRCLIKSGTVVGQKGFGFERDANGNPVAFNHYGSVVIGDFVEIGALSTIAAGALVDTRISDYVKIDDHVFVAHNVVIGESSLIIAGAEISGGVSIGKRCWLGPNCSIIDGISIGDEAFIGIGAVVTKSVPPAVVVAGNPARVLRRLDE